MQKDKPKSPLSPMELMLKAVEKATQEEDNPEEYLKVADPLNRWIDFQCFQSTGFSSFITTLQTQNSMKAKCLVDMFQTTIAVIDLFYPVSSSTCI